MSYRLLKYVLSLFLCFMSSQSLYSEAAAQNEKPYNLSVCAIFMNEAPFLREWIEYHRVVGVDHFYLYNNDSTDDFLSVLDPYLKEGVVTLIDWPDRQGEIKQDGYVWVVNTQLPAYEDACRVQACGQTKWLALIDVDEFMLPIKDESITQLLERYKDAPAVSLAWQVYGTSGVQTLPKDRLLIETFHRVCPPKHSLHDCVKTILKPELYSHFAWPPHTCAYLNEQPAVFPLKTEARINHYINRTIDYFLSNKVPGKEKVLQRKMEQKEIENWLKVGNDLEDEGHAIHRFAGALRKRLGLAPEAGNRATMVQTSITDDGAYPAFCWEASKKAAVFKNFKVEPVYAAVLEHVSREQGADYLAIALKQAPQYRNKLPDFAANDRLGGPLTYSYNEYGTFSPTTLRYMKVASDFEMLFGNLDNQDIIEIGCGYGGQCLVLSKLFKWKSYTIVDLPGPLALIKKYLTEHKVENVTYKTLDELSPTMSYDLAISNYAFSECTRAVQEEYIKKVLDRSKKGYLTCNDSSHIPSLSSFTKEDLVTRLREKSCQLLPEVPQTAPRNYLVTWPATALPVDTVVFSYDRPMQLYAYLESAEKYMKGVNETHVIYRTSAPQFDEGYKIVQARFPEVLFHKQSENPGADFKPLVLSSVYSSRSMSPYVLFAVDDIVVKDRVDLKECARALEREKAWGFFLRLGKNISHCYMMNQPSPCPEFQASDDTISWQFSKAVSEWAYPNNLDMTVYRKSDIKQFLSEQAYVNPNMLEFSWTGFADLEKRGVAFTQSKMVNIPLNLTNPSGNRSMNSYTTAALLQKFQEGYKIDVAAMYGMKNESPHMAYEPLFITR